MRIALSRVEVLASGRLALSLRDDPRGYADQIYRAAAEIQWEPDGKRYISPRPELGPPRKHFAHVAAAAKGELGYELVPDANTEWVNVPAEERAAIELQAHDADA